MILDSGLLFWATLYTTSGSHKPETASKLAVMSLYTLGTLPIHNAHGSAGIGQSTGSIILSANEDELFHVSKKNCCFLESVEFYGRSTSQF